MRAATAPTPVTDSQRQILQVLAKSHTAPQREVARAKALLLAADGVANTAIAARVGVSPTSVAAWRGRFREEGLKDLGVVRAGRGRKASIPVEKIEAIVEAPCTRSQRARRTGRAGRW